MPAKHEWVALAVSIGVRFVGLVFILTGVYSIVFRQRLQRNAVKLAEQMPFLAWYAEMLASRFYVVVQ